MWALRVNGADVPGRFIIVDGRFVPVESALGDEDENRVCRMKIPQSVATID